jgi:hypothetical protein
MFEFLVWGPPFSDSLSLFLSLARTVRGGTVPRPSPRQPAQLLSYTLSSRHRAESFSFLAVNELKHRLELESTPAPFPGANTARRLAASEPRLVPEPNRWSRTAEAVAGSQPRPSASSGQNALRLGIRLHEQRHISFSVGEPRRHSSSSPEPPSVASPFPFPAGSELIVVSIPVAVVELHRFEPSHRRLPRGNSSPSVPFSLVSATETVPAAAPPPCAPGAVRLVHHANVVAPSLLCGPAVADPTAHTSRLLAAQLRRTWDPNPSRATSRIGMPVYSFSNTKLIQLSRKSSKFHTKLNIS